MTSRAIIEGETQIVEAKCPKCKKLHKIKLTGVILIQPARPWKYCRPCREGLYFIQPVDFFDYYI